MVVSEFKQFSGKITERVVPGAAVHNYLTSNTDSLRTSVPAQQ